jgi:hypothetical protein
MLEAVAACCTGAVVSAAANLSWPLVTANRPTRLKLDSSRATVFRDEL